MSNSSKESGGAQAIKPMPEIKTVAGPLSDKAPQARPGVSNKTLRDNGIVPGPVESDGKCNLTIPYFNFDNGESGRCPILDGPKLDREFRRTRLAQPDGDKKYSQPAESSPHLYFPLGVEDLIRQLGYMIIVEGEFKALALWKPDSPQSGLAAYTTTRAMENWLRNSRS
jgi:hypothetical protein